MTTELRKTGGIGRNVTYDVYRLGERVGEIHRKGAHTVVIAGHFGEWLETCRTFEEAKLRAAEREFPAKSEVHQRVCARVATMRLAQLERANGPAIAALARQMLGGDGSAADRLRQLLDAITSLANDRTHSTRRTKNARPANWKTEYLLDKPVN
jgi:hypothetical protein